MFITTRAVYQMTAEGYILISKKGFDYSGPVANCKGDNTAKQAEEQQAAFNAQLMTVFNKQFQNQSKTLDYLKGILKPMIDKPTGYSPEALAAMRTGATDQLSSAYQNAQKTMQNTTFARGGEDLPSGVNAQLSSSLLQNEASDKAKAQNDITLQDETLKENNYWAAINALNGNAVEQNPLGYAGAATSGSGAVAGLSQAVTAANGPGFGAILGGAVGGLAGMGSAAITKYCWVAAASFNENFATGIKTNLVRNWLWNVWSKNWYATPILWLYSKTGRWVATKPILVSMLKPLFEAALRRAKE